VVTGTVISSSAFNALTADLATGLSTAITKDGQTANTVRIPFAQGINSTLATDSTSGSTGSIFTAGGVGIAKALFVGTNATVVGTLGVTGAATFSATPIFSALTASSAVATDASKNLVSVTNTGTGNNVLATSPTLVTPVLGAASATSVTVDAGAVGTPSITTTGDTNTGIFFPAADTIAFSEGGAEAMRIDSSGNVGIGTTLPAGKLDVRGASYFGTPNTFIIGDDGGSDGAFLNETASVPMRFLTAGTERMRIDSSGNVLVGTTSKFGDAVLSVLSTSPNQMVYLRTSHPSVPGGIFINYSASAPNNTGSEFLFCNDTAQTRMNVRSNGGIANYSGNNVNLSDRREKTNFALAKPYLDVICAIPVQTFNYIDQNTEEDPGLTLGVAAQDVQAVAPELVSESDWSTEKDGSKMRLSIYQTDLQYALMKAIQEQQALITSLTERIVALEAK
jgi:hypothetical protein